MIRVTVKNRDAAAVPLSPITSGAVGIPVHFNFSDDWMQEGLTRVACFRNPEVDDVYSMILDETNDTVVPWELLVNHGGVLFIGAYAENGAGTTVIPTIWAEAGMIVEGTKDGEQSADPTPTQWAQIRDLASEAAASAAAAEGYAEHAPIIASDYWYTWNGEEYETTGQKATGEDGTDGQDGQDGISPGVEITSVTGGHAITITDRDHPSGQSFNVLDGETGQTGPAGPGVPSGGTSGQFLKKASATDYDTSWVSANAGDILFDGTETYAADTVGNEIASVKRSLNVRLKGERIHVSGTTDSVGRITVAKTISSTDIYVVTNVSSDVQTSYSVTVNGIASASVTLRIRSIADNSSIANTAVDFYAMLIGL